MSLLAPIICDNGTGYSKVGYACCRYIAPHRFPDLSIISTRLGLLEIQTRLCEHASRLVLPTLPPFAHSLFLTAFSQLPSRLVDLPPSRADRDLQYQQSLGISPRSAGSRTSTSLSVTKRSLMPRHQDTVSTTRSAMVRSTTGITWNATGNRRSSSTSAPSRRTTISFWSVRRSVLYACPRDPLT